MKLPIKADWSEFQGRYTLTDADGNYVASVQVYQTPRPAGQYDEKRRHDAAKAIVEALNSQP